jgi:predicted GNAT superfamily acetyltransferase
MIRLEENNLEAVMSVLNEIPEFDNLPNLENIKTRLLDKPHLILTAHVENQPVGFKIGYERDGRFYSWLGGVIPSYRKYGVGGMLADRQEEWARQQGYASVWMKTRNRFPAMLLMAVRRGFRITAIEARDKIAEHRIVLEKSL